MSSNIGGRSIKMSSEAISKATRRSLSNDSTKSPNRTSSKSIIHRVFDKIKTSKEERKAAKENKLKNKAKAPAAADAQFVAPIPLPVTPIVKSEAEKEIKEDVEVKQEVEVVEEGAAAAAPPPEPEVQPELEPIHSETTVQATATVDSDLKTSEIPVEQKAVIETGIEAIEDQHIGNVEDDLKASQMDLEKKQSEPKMQVTEKTVIGGGLGKVQNLKEEEYFCKQQKDLLQKIAQDPDFCTKNPQECECAENVTQEEFFRDDDDFSGRQKTIQTTNKNLREEIHFYEENMECLKRTPSKSSLKKEGGTTTDVEKLQ